VKCPNCNAELTERPCAECGWPETTRPPPPTFWQQLKRRRLRAQTAAEEPQQQGCTGCCAVFVALPATAGAIFFFQVGSAAGWTSDGPAMLFIMLGLVVCGLVAITAWGGVFADAARPHLPWWMRGDE
jgi:hypothetical protein